MKITVSPGTIEKARANLLVVPFLEDSKPPKAWKKGMKGELGKVHVLFEGCCGSKLVMLVGLGKKKNLDQERVRKAMASAVRKARELGVEEFSVLGTIPGLKEQDAANSITEGIVLGDYSFEKYKTKKEGKPLKSATILSSKAVEKGVQEAALVCKNVNMARDLVNENADVATPEKLAGLAREIASKTRLKLKVLGKSELKKLGMNLLLAVGSGSRFEPKMIILEYRGSPKKDRIALLGKGITFDSGGINLKPSGYIETMKQDMAGAAAVLGIMKSVAELRLRVNLVAVVPVCENMIGPGSYKPGDVLRSYSGKTVEVENTDAEGRLILADAISYAEKNLKPTQIIDIATLTGTALMIFGEFITPLIGEGKAKKHLLEAGKATGDLVWELPLTEEFIEEVKGEIADVRNLGYNKRYAGTLMGAAFLKSFAGKTPLLHLDIGGTAWAEKQRGYRPKNATGMGVRLLVEALKKL